jgi:hypothetical protein
MATNGPQLSFEVRDYRTVSISEPSLREFIPSVPVVPGTGDLSGNAEMPNRLC